LALLALEAGAKEKQMTPRPIYRWKCFWFGLLCLAFLGSAWVRSLGYQSSLHISWGGGESILAQERGEVQLAVPAHPSRPQIVFYDSAIDREETEIASAFTHAVFKGDQLFWTAHWFLMLLFSVPWVAFLGWRRRRQNRAKEMS
jgi:hypothetical protein